MYLAITVWKNKNKFYTVLIRKDVFSILIQTQDDHHLATPHGPAQRIPGRTAQPSPGPRTEIKFTQDGRKDEEFPQTRRRHNLLQCFSCCSVWILPIMEYGWISQIFMSSPSTHNTSLKTYTYLLPVSNIEPMQCKIMIQEMVMMKV